METKGLTLQAALASGRKIRHPEGVSKDFWMPDEMSVFTIQSIMSKEWEIEPEPEKPVEPIVWETKLQFAGTTLGFTSLPYGIWPKVNGRWVKVTVEVLK